MPTLRTALCTAVIASSGAVACTSNPAQEGDTASVGVSLQGSYRGDGWEGTRPPGSVGDWIKWLELGECWIELSLADERGNTSLVLRGPYELIDVRTRAANDDPAPFNRYRVERFGSAPIQYRAQIRFHPSQQYYDRWYQGTIDWRPSTDDDRWAGAVRLYLPDLDNRGGRKEQEFYFFQQSPRTPIPRGYGCDDLYLVGPGTGGPKACSPVNGGAAAVCADPEDEEIPGDDASGIPDEELPPDEEDGDSGYDGDDPDDESDPWYPDDGGYDDSCYDPYCCCDETWDCSCGCVDDYFEC